ncbi:Golgi-associated PDZ and coiled-coil motif-containing protein [Hypsibius exemplaris]|uniref:Golgi-associated PDZ and coiled-coil motif-containing protein n=1 Tax=Hypsibius exemplaris TaxID=2072580 RepID=A0A1W0WJY0_HYPEX|nr:Golgi-associated PDZ and coiled-coil motif-containing protein [Hypsibius exemplaris]
MSLSTTTFKWLDLLESEFDRAYVELDGILCHPEAEIEYVIGPARQKMALLCATFAQLSEKAQTVFQSNAKLEAQICNLRRDLVEAQSQRDCIEQEHRNLLFQVHKAQLENVKDRPEGHAILLSLMHGRGDSNSVSLDEARLNREVLQLRKENLQLRESLIYQQSKLFGAHLAARYLDKELAGRIQQIQLLARDSKAYQHNQLWDQLESEISLQRHKTIVQACRSRSQRKEARRKSENAQLTPPTAFVDDYVPPAPKPSNNLAGVVRQVEIYKQPGVNVGLAVTGGQDHGVPILISEIKAGMLAEANGKFIVGDAVLSVNGIDLQRAKHSEAVQVLSQLEGNVIFELLYVQPESDEDGSVEDIHFGFDHSGTMDSKPDSLRALSARSDSNSATSRISQLRRPRFPGRAVDVTGQDSSPVAHETTSV